MVSGKSRYTSGVAVINLGFHGCRLRHEGEAQALRPLPLLRYNSYYLVYYSAKYTAEISFFCARVYNTHTHSHFIVIQRIDFYDCRGTASSLSPFASWRIFHFSFFLLIFRDVNSFHLPSIHSDCIAFFMFPFFIQVVLPVTREMPPSVKSFPVISKSRESQKRRKRS